MRLAPTIARWPGWAVLAVGLVLGTAAPAGAQPVGERIAESKKLLQEGKLDETARVAEEVLATHRQMFGEKHEVVAGTLGFLADVHRRRGDLNAALKARREAVEILTARFGEKHWRAVGSRAALAHLERVAGLAPGPRRRLAEAERLRQESDRLIRQGKPSEALPPARQRAAIVAEVLGEKHLERAQALQDLARVQKETGDFADAEAGCRGAVAVLREAVGEAHPEYADALTQLGLLYRETSSAARAGPVFQQVLTIYKEAVGEDDPVYAAGLVNLATTYEQLGAYARSEELFRRALRVRTRALGPRHPALATDLNNLAALYVAMGDLTRAEPLYRQAVELWKQADPRGPAYATGLNNLASLYQSRGDHVRAEALYRESLEIRKAVRGENHTDYANSLGNLASLYLGRGEPARAEPLLREALEVKARVLGERHPDYADTLQALAGLYRDAGAYPRAEAMFTRAVDVTRQTLGEWHPRYADALAGLAGLHHARGDPARAEKLLGQAVALKEKLLGETFTAQGERQRLLFLQKLRAGLNGYVSAALAAGVPPRDVYRHVLAWKGAVAARQAEDRLARDKPQVRELAGQLRAARLRLSNLSMLVPPPRREDEWFRTMDRLRDEKEDLETRLSQASAAFRHERELVRVGPDAVARALPQGAALVDLFEYGHRSPPPARRGPMRSERRLLAFVVRRDRDPVCVPLGPAGDVRRAVDSWWAALENGQDGVLEEAAAEVARLVWKPVEGHLGDADTVLVSPDAAVARMPLAALPGKRPGSYLVEDRAVGLVTSGRHVVEAFASAARGRSRGLLAVGGIDYGQAAAPDQEEFLALPGTEREARTLLGAFRRDFPGERSELLTGTVPTESRLKAELSPADPSKRWRYVHIAGHGFFSPPDVASALWADTPGRKGGISDTLAGRLAETFGFNPLVLSGLVLAGANGPAGPYGEDGILTAEEVMGLDLRGTELVVLSACDTGAGEVAGGEGVLGLQRAFEAAGARTLLTSLWLVDDSAATVLMEEFYSNLWRKRLPKLEALRQAQLAVLKNPGRIGERRKELDEQLAKKNPKPSRRPLLPEVERLRERTHPALWAAFVLSGDGR